MPGRPKLSAQSEGFSGCGSRIESSGLTSQYVSELRVAIVVVVVESSGLRAGGGEAAVAGGTVAVGAGGGAHGAATRWKGSFG